MRTTENLLGGRPKVRIKKKDFRPEVSGNTDINPKFRFNVVSINRMIVETERRFKLSHSDKGSTFDQLASEMFKLSCTSD